MTTSLIVWSLLSIQDVVLLNLVSQLSNLKWCKWCVGRMLTHLPIYLLKWTIWHLHRFRFDYRSVFPFMRAYDSLIDRNRSISQKSIVICCCFFPWFFHIVSLSDLTSHGIQESHEQLFIVLINLNSIYKAIPRHEPSYIKLYKH